MVTDPARSEPNFRDQITVDIANGASLSDAGRLRGMVPIAIVIPATWTAANLTFQGSVDGVTYVDVYKDDGTERTVTAAASRFIVLTPQDWFPFEYLKIRSGTTGSPVNQGGARTITLVIGI